MRIIQYEEKNPGKKKHQQRYKQTLCQEEDMPVIFFQNSVSVYIQLTYVLA